MAKEFYTERDIEDMANQGQRSIIINDDVVLTDLAYEKARRLGLELVQKDESPPAAPIRPYLNKKSLSPGSISNSSRSVSKLDKIRASVKSAVQARLDTPVNDELLDRIIDRIAAELGIK